MKQFQKLRSTKEKCTVTLSFTELGPVPYSTHKDYRLSVVRGKFNWNSNYAPTQRTPGGAKVCIDGSCRFVSTMYRNDGHYMEKSVMISVQFKDTRSNNPSVCGTTSLDLARVTSGPVLVPVSLNIGTVTITAQLKVGVSLGDGPAPGTSGFDDSRSIASTHSSASRSSQPNVQPYKPTGAAAAVAQQQAPNAALQAAAADTALMQRQHQRYQAILSALEGLPADRKVLVATKKEYVGRKLATGKMTSQELDRIVKYIDELEATVASTPAVSQQPSAGQRGSSSHLSAPVPPAGMSSSHVRSSSAQQQQQQTTPSRTAAAPPRSSQQNRPQPEEQQPLKSVLRPSSYAQQQQQQSNRHQDPVPFPAPTPERAPTSSGGNTFKGKRSYDGYYDSDCDSDNTGWGALDEASRLRGITQDDITERSFGGRARQYDDDEDDSEITENDWEECGSESPPRRSRQNGGGHARPLGADSRVQSEYSVRDRPGSGRRARQQHHDDVELDDDCFDDDYQPVAAVGRGGGRGRGATAPRQQQSAGYRSRAGRGRRNNPPATQPSCEACAIS